MSYVFSFGFMADLVANKGEVTLEHDGTEQRLTWPFVCLNSSLLPEDDVDVQV